MKNGCLLLLLLLISIAGQSQLSGVEQYREQWHVRMYPDIRQTSISIDNAILQEEIRFRANNPVRMSIAVNKGDFGAGISLFKLAQNSTRTHGKTSGIDVFAEFFRSNYSAIFRLQRFRGWYSHENPSGIPQNLTLKNYVRPDLRNFLLSTRVIYYFNTNNYSIKAPINFTEVQLQSAGSFMASVTPFVNSLSGDSSLVPGYGANAQPYVSRLLLYGINFGIGYAYTFVFNNPVFINITCLPSFGLSGLMSKSDVERQHRAALPTQILLRGTLGYNTERYFFGISPRIEREFSRSMPLQHNFSATAFQLSAYVGIRW